MLQDRKILEENLIQNINKIKTKKKLVKEIKDELAKYEILHGDTQGYIGSPEKEIPELDSRVLYLLTDAIHRIAHQELGESALLIIPTEYFTEQQIIESKHFSGSLTEEERLELPLTLGNATVVGNNAYMVTVHVKTIKQLLDSQILDYDFELQRESSYVKRKDSIMPVPTVNMSNVKEISSHLQQGTLVPTTLVFNCDARQSELIYDPKRLELTIPKETEKLWVVDGWHRCKGLQNALQVNPDINFNFAVLITNYSTKRAQQYQAQLAKATPIAKTRIQELEAKRYADTVMQQLKVESDLKGKIKTTKDNRIGQYDLELVSYNILADTIEEEFKMNSNPEALDVADYLTNFFNYLIGTFSQEFLENVVETRKNSIINNNNMFIGYVILARRMQDEGIKYRKIKDIVGSIDFSRDNHLWAELNILDDNGTFSDLNKARKNIREYFKKLNIKELLEEGVTNG